MDLEFLTYTFVGLSFLLYVCIAVWSRAGSTSEFYIAGKGVPPLANGMATAADWMSAASFISMAGIIAFMGRDGSMYLMGWTGGYVILAMLLAPYLRKFGKFTVPDFVGDRYYSDIARVVAVICVIFISFTYVAGQMRGVGIVFSRFLQVDIDVGVIIGMAIVFSYAVMGGMKGITYTQVAQYCVMIFAYTVPALFLSYQITDTILPQFGVGATMENGQTLLQTLDGVVTELGFSAFTAGNKGTLDILFVTLALMLGTAGLPHVLVRFFTVPKVRDARKSAFWALIFIAILYTSASSIAAFGRLNLVHTVNGDDGKGTEYSVMPSWFKNWENSGLIAWVDLNGDGRVQYAAGKAVMGKPKFAGSAEDPAARTEAGARKVTNPASGEFDASKQPFANEIFVDRDIMVLANPEIAQLPNWVIALVAAGAMAAALSTAAGLLLVISTSISHDLMKKTLAPEITEQQELLYARLAAAAAVVVAGYFGMNPPGYVAAIVALAFGLACASFFPTLFMGVFYKRMNKEGAITGMLVGLISTGAYIVYFKFMGGTKDEWFMGISPEGFGVIGMILHVISAVVVSSATAPPPQEVQDMVEEIRIPKGAGAAQDH